MKTPEEIKRGFEICLRAPFKSCDGCAYDEKNCPQCVESLVRDALAYIQQLEQDNAKKDERIRELEREKEAFMDDAKGLCGLCKHMYKTCSQHPCRNCMDGSNWEWRGVEDEKHET